MTAATQICARPFLTTEWRSLVMLTYEVDSELLCPYVPAGTELDDWNGAALMSLVGFMFYNTRVLGWPVPLHRNFEELNLRFYVRRRGPEGWQRGVVFIKEIVARRAVAVVARLLYGENYAVLPMWHTRQAPKGESSTGQKVGYGWRVNGCENWIRAETSDHPQLPAEGSLEQFIAEHYWGYTKRRDGHTWEYRVEHDPWRVSQAERIDMVCDAAQLYGAPLAKHLAAQPVSALVADGSAVTVFKGAQLTAS